MPVLNGFKKFEAEQRGEKIDDDLDVAKTEARERFAERAEASFRFDERAEYPRMRGIAFDLARAAYNRRLIDSMGVYRPSPTPAQRYSGDESPFRNTRGERQDDDGRTRVRPDAASIAHAVLGGQSGWTVYGEATDGRFIVRGPQMGSADEDTRTRATALQNIFSAYRLALTPLSDHSNIWVVHEASDSEGS